MIVFYFAGHVKLVSSDPAVQPEIDPCYLTDLRDIKTLAAGVRKSIEYVHF